ncbi:MAG: LptE family protein [Phycisphaeraceae bacterium]|nr:LptE family protein [Phycisphaeraceae bacterium]
MTRQFRLDILCPSAFAVRTARVRGIWMVIAMALLTAIGCGYTQKDLYPADVRTVAVPIFKNRTFHKGLEFDLTEALIKEIELRTPYKVVPQEAADTILDGRIDSATTSQLSRTSVGAVTQETELRIVVTLEWKNLRTGQILRRRDGLEAVGRTVSTRPIGEPVEVGQHQAVQNMANMIVNLLRADW